MGFFFKQVAKFENQNLSSKNKVAKLEWLAENKYETHPQKVYTLFHEYYHSTCAKDLRKKVQHDWTDLERA